MPRIPDANAETLDPRAEKLLSAAEKKIGRIPNMFLPLAQSPAALEGYLTLSGILSGGELPGALREQIALAVAGFNKCTYCASAHAAIARSLSIDEGELAENLRGRSSDPRAAATLSLARSIVERRGAVDDAGLEQARTAGLSDGEIVETVAHVALNVFTNYLNRLVDPEIDFPILSAELVAEAPAHAEAG